MTGLDPAMSERLCLTLLHSLWQGALLALMAWLVGRWWGERRVGAAYATHTAALVVALLAAPVTFILLAPAKAPVALVEPIGVAPGAAPGRFRPLPGLAPAAESPSLSPAATPRETAPPVGPRVEAFSLRALVPWATGVYFAGVLLMLARLVGSVVGMERLRAAAEPIVSGPAHEALAGLCRRWSLRAAPVLAHAERVVVPKVVGLIKPTILLPSSALTGLSPAELELILAHELAHVRRYDLWVNLLQRLTEALLFFNPTVWWLSRRVSTLREYCCDDRACAALSGQAEPRIRYAEALLHAVELQGAGKAGQAAALAATGRSPSELRRRVARLFGESLGEPIRLSRGGLALVIAGASLLLLAPTVADSSVSEKPAANANQEETDERAPSRGKATISGKIVAPDDSSPQPNGWFYSRAERGSHTSHCTEGRFDDTFACVVETGTINLKFFSDDNYAPAVVGPFELKNGETLSEVRVELVPGHDQVVTVVGEGNLPIEGATVVAHPLLNGNTNGPVIPHTTDASGRVRLEHVAPDTHYAFRVEAPGYQKLRTEPRRMPHAGKGLLQLWMVRAQPATGLTRFPDGSPSPGTRVMQLGEIEPSGFMDSSPSPKLLTQADSSGRFVLNSLRDESSYLMLFEAMDFNRVVVTDVVAGTQDAQIVFPDRRDMVVRFRGDLDQVPQRDGKPYAKIYQRFDFSREGRGASTLFTDYVTFEPTADGGEAIYHGLTIDLRPEAGPQQVEVMLGQDESTKQTVEIARDSDRATLVEFDLDKSPRSRIAPDTIGVHRPDGSAMWFQSGQEVYSVIYYPGYFQDGLGGSVDGRGDWKVNGFLNLRAGAAGEARKLPVECDSVRGELRLRIAGQEYDLSEGRVFAVSEGGVVRQLATEARPPLGKQGDPASVERLKQLIDTVEAVAAIPADDGGSDPNTMRVRILDEQGRPLAGAKLYANRNRPKGSEGKGIINREFVADKAGEVILPIDRGRDSTKLWAWAPGRVSEFVWLDRGPEDQDDRLPAEFEFRLARGTPLGGVVVDQQGEPIAGVHVRVQANLKETFIDNYSVNATPVVSDWLTDSFYQPKITTDAQGRWRLDNAPAPTEGEDPWLLLLKLDHPDYTSDANWGGLQRAQGVTASELRSGEAKIVLSRGTRVEGRVVDLDGNPINKGWVVWSDTPYFMQGVFEAEINEDGAFETPHLPPGEHPITIVAPGYASQRRVVEVRPGVESQRFELKPGKRIEIRFVDKAGEPIPNVGVYLANSSAPNTWQGSNALHNHKHPNVPDYGIDRKSDKQGVYLWDWAPEEPVTYRIGAKGFAGQKVTLLAKSEAHVVTLAEERVVHGAVTDAVTGKPIPKFRAMPVIVFRKDFYSTRFSDTKPGSEGRYEVPLTGSGDPENHYRVRIEAEGYRSVVSDRSFGPLDGRVAFDVQLEPAAARRGRVLDDEGEPVAGARVIEGTPTWVPHTSNGEPDSHGERIVRTDNQGRFELSATSEPVRVRVLHEKGVAERRIDPDEDSIGEVRLEPWASVSGRLVQEGEPIVNQSIYFSPLVRRGLGEARFQDSYYSRTDAQGRFHLKRLPPGAGSLRAHLGPWRESPLTSGESLPLDLKPGERREVVLGGEGAVVVGRVAATGRDAAPLDRRWSLNHLVSRDRGADPLPADFPELGFDPSGPVRSSWGLDPRFHDWLATREHHFVKLTPDGGLRITGVSPGEYDLVLRLYEQPAGCLVETVGEKVVPVRVEGEGTIDLGTIDVPCRTGPRVGSDMRVYEFVDTTGRRQSVADMRGRYVVMHAWATWCEPCLASLTEIAAAAERLDGEAVTFVGLNLDTDERRARNLAERRAWGWSQNYLGDASDMARQLAISGVPTYYLIGPDGRLIASSNEWKTIHELITDKLRPRLSQR